MVGFTLPSVTLRYIHLVPTIMMDDGKQQWNIWLPMWLEVGTTTTQMTSFNLTCPHATCLSRLQP
jgi:hypothetical protein